MSWYIHEQTVSYRTMVRGATSVPTRMETQLSPVSSDGPGDISPIAHVLLSC